LPDKTKEEDVWKEPEWFQTLRKFYLEYLKQKEREEKNELK